MKRLALIASALAVFAALFALGQNIRPIPTPFLGYSTSGNLGMPAQSDPTLCVFGLEPLNFRMDLATPIFKFCSATNTWSSLLSSNAAGTMNGTLTPVGGVIQSTVSMPYTAFTTLANPNSLIAAGSVTDTIAEYWSQLFIPTNATLTGACLLNGATVTTDKHIYFLANAAGTIVANTSLTSVADSGASRYQCQAFTATVAVVGPQTYFIGTQPNGTTDNFLAYATGGAPTNYGTGLTTAGTFGTLVNITPTVTFTTAQGPLMMVY